MYNGQSVNVTDRSFVNVVHDQYVALFMSVFELKLGLDSVYLYIINTKENFISTLRQLNNCFLLKYTKN